MVQTLAKLPSFLAFSLQNIIQKLVPAVLRLIEKTSTTLPVDVTAALFAARDREATGTRARQILEASLASLDLAARAETPVCQDTGWPTFWVTAPAEMQALLCAAIETAVPLATQKGFLRPNAVDSLTGENSGDNTGAGLPTIYFETGADIEIRLLLKGGGCENVSAQISLPADLPDFGAAGRDLAGVKKAVLQIVKDAGGRGCAPGILGVVIGGDRAAGWAAAKKLLLQKIGTENPVPELAALSAEILHAANALEIGPQGLGGRTTLLDCFCAAQHRLPASFFVTVSYLCWAARRGSVRLNAAGEVTSDDFARPLPDVPAPDFSQAKAIKLPISEADARSLKVGDAVRISGRIFTGRDRLHAFVAAGGELPVDLRGGAIYHAGPIAIQNETTNAWEIRAIGPTTSLREEPYQAAVLARTGARVIIGKGGMGAATAAALQKHGGVYVQAIGGAAAFYAAKVRRVAGVHFLEWGVPEALWELEVEDFWGVVTMAAGEI